MNSSDRVPTTLRRLREAAGASVRDLGDRTFSSASRITNTETGIRWPDDRRWIEHLDAELGGNGELITAWDADKAQREADQRTQRLLVASAAATDELLAMPDVADVDQLQGGVADLAVRYLSTPPGPMLEATTAVQGELIRRLREGAYQPGELRELRIALARAAGVLAYAALDLGRPDMAMRHAELTARLGGLAQISELQAWAYGTESLIARFDKRYDQAFSLIIDGLRHVDHSAGTAGIRLLAGAAQCAANLGHTERALDYLAEADQVRATHRPIDEVAGLFTFSEAKGRYYGGSSLMWLPERDALTRAAEEATAAIEMWQDEPDASRSLDDEHLAHVYAATAYVRLGDLDAAMISIRPILGLAPDQRISWLVRRVRELAVHMGSGRYAGSAYAAACIDQLRDWTG